MICSVQELNELDLGVHMELMEEWNECKFDWQPAQVILHGYYTRVIQEDHGVIEPESEAQAHAYHHGLFVCTYVTHGEGDLVSMRVYTSTPVKVCEIAPYSKKHTRLSIMLDHIAGYEMYTEGDHQQLYREMFGTDDPISKPRTA